MKNDDAYMILAGFVVKSTTNPKFPPTYITTIIGGVEYCVYDSYYSSLNGVAEKKIGIILDENDDSNTTYLVIDNKNDSEFSIFEYSDSLVSTESTPHRYLLMADTVDGIRAYKSDKIVLGEQIALNSVLVVNPIGMEPQDAAQDNIVVEYSDLSTEEFIFNDILILNGLVWLPISGNKEITTIKIGETTYQWHLSVKLNFGSNAPSGGCYVTLSDGSVQLIKSSDITSIINEQHGYITENVAIVDSYHLALYYQTIMLSDETTQIPSGSIRTIVQTGNVVGEISTFDHQFDKPLPWLDYTVDHHNNWYSNINISVPYYSCDDDGSIHELTKEYDSCSYAYMARLRYYYVQKSYDWKTFCKHGTETIKYQYKQLVDDLHFNPQVISHLITTDSVSSYGMDNITNANTTVAQLAFQLFSGTFIDTDNEMLYVAQHCGEFNALSFGYGGHNAIFNITNTSNSCRFSGIIQYAWAIKTTVCVGTFDLKKTSPIPTIKKEYVVVTRNYPYGVWNESRVQYRTITYRNCVTVEARTIEANGKISKGNTGISVCGPFWFCNPLPKPTSNDSEFSATCPPANARCQQVFVLYKDKTICPASSCDSTPPINYSIEYKLISISDEASAEEFSESAYREKFELNEEKPFEITTSQTYCYDCVHKTTTEKTIYSMQPTKFPAKREIAQFIYVQNQQQYQQVLDLIDSLYDITCTTSSAECNCGNGIEITTTFDPLNPPDPVQMNIGITNSKNPSISLPQSVSKEYVGWSWSLIETGHSLTYQSGKVGRDGSLIGISSTFTSIYSYNGYMCLKLNPPTCT